MALRSFLASFLWLCGRRGARRPCARGRRGFAARLSDRHPEAFERTENSLQVLVGIAVVVLDMLDARERILEARWNHGGFQVHGQDVPLALAGQQDFLGHIVRMDGRFRHHQQQDLGLVQGI